jgi:hypothetical protein
MLSSDILTMFRGRGDEIKMHPLTFAEYYSAVGGDKNSAFEEYAMYGGMPLILSRPDDASKMNYLTNLFTETYIKDIVERKKVQNEDVLSKVLDLLCSSVGSLTNPTNIARSLNATTDNKVSDNTIKTYINYLLDAFLFSESKRYDVKGKSYFDYPQKYYAEDIGLRNARIGFRQQEMTHIMENMVYNELIARGFKVDVGVVYVREKNKKGDYERKAREIDFVVNGNGKKIYIQSAYAMGDEEKIISENKPLNLTGDSFQKIIVRKDVGKRWYNDDGILNINIIDFLLDSSVVSL